VGAEQGTGRSWSGGGGGSDESVAENSSRSERRKRRVRGQAGGRDSGNAQSTVLHDTITRTVDTSLSTSQMVRYLRKCTLALDNRLCAQCVHGFTNNGDGDGDCGGGSRVDLSDKKGGGERRAKVRVTPAGEHGTQVTSANSRGSAHYSRRL
jgi:hypothetical protein